MNKCPKCKEVGCVRADDRFCLAHQLTRERRVSAALTRQLADVACGHCRTVESSACDTCPVENLDLVRRKAEAEADKGQG